MTIQVFTDGSCRSNGKFTSKGGIGVYFSHLHPKNKCLSYTNARERFYNNYNIVENIGIATNNKTELLAILVALEECKEFLLEKEKITIYSDSKYSINCCTTWGDTWEKNNWKTSTNKDVLNKIIISTIRNEFIKKYHMFINFIYVKSHTKPPDMILYPVEYNIWVGNNEADKFACIGTSLD